MLVEVRDHSLEGENRSNNVIEDLSINLLRKQLHKSKVAGEDNAGWQR